MANRLKIKQIEGTSPSKFVTTDTNGVLVSVLTISTSSVPEGISPPNLYFTDERAQDAIGNNLIDSSNIDFTYNDVANTITADLTNTGITPGVYNYATITVDAKGRLTFAVDNPATVTGTGTTDVLTKWIDGPNSIIGDSIVSESGTILTVSGDVVPKTPSSTWDLGSPALRWDTLFIDSDIDYLNSLIFKVSGTEKIRMTSSGELLINTTSGGALLYIKGTNNLVNTYSFRIDQATGLNLNLLSVENDGRVVIGTQNTNSRELNVYGTVLARASVQIGLNASAGTGGTGAGDALLVDDEIYEDGSGITFVTTSAATGASANIEGINNQAISSASGSATPALTAIYNRALANSSRPFSSSTFKGYDVNMDSSALQTGTIADAIGYNVGNPSFLGSKPTTNMGILVRDQGYSGVTNAYGIRISTQSAATNNYGIAVQSNFSGFGTLTPNSTVHIVGTLRYEDGSEALNKILKSDASGNATWSTIAGVGGVTGTGTIDRVTKWTGTTSIGDGSWAFSGNTIYPVVDGSNIGLTGTNRVGTIYMSSIIDYATNLVFNNATQKMVLTAGGKLGIGALTPTRDVHVQYSSQSPVSTAFPTIGPNNTNTVQENGTSAFNLAAIGASAGNGVVQGSLIASYQNGAVFRTALILNSFTGQPIDFIVGTSAIAGTIDAVGNWGLGTTSPGSTHKLQVSGNAYITSKLGIGTYFNSADPGVLQVTGFSLFTGQVSTGTNPSFSPDPNCGFKINYYSTNADNKTASLCIGFDNLNTSGFANAAGIDVVTNNSATGTAIPDVIGIRNTVQTFATTNFTSGTFKGYEVLMSTFTTQTGTVTDSIAHSIISPQWLGSIPATVSGVVIENQGFAGTVSSYAIRIDSQSGSLNNYGIVVSGSGTFSGFGMTSTPGAVLHVNGSQSFMYTDGNEAAGYVLTSDFTGVASWAPVNTATTIARTVFVSKNGNDGTGLAERLDKPFLTLAAARIAAVALTPTSTSRVLIHVFTGYYNETLTLANNVDWHLSDAVIERTAGTGATVTDGGVSVNSMIYGSSRIVRSSGGLVQEGIKVSGATSNVSVNCDSVTAYSDGVNFDSSSGTLHIKCNTISGTNGYGVNVQQGLLFIDVNIITGESGIINANTNSPEIHIKAKQIFSTSVSECINLESGLAFIHADEITSVGIGVSSLGTGSYFIYCPNIVSSANQAIVVGDTSSLWVYGNASGSSASGVDVIGGTLVFTGDYITTSSGQNGVNQSGGTATFNNVTISGNGAAAAYVHTAGSFTLNDVRVRAGSSGNQHALDIANSGTKIIKNMILVATGTGASVNHPGTATLKVYGSSVANNAVSSGLTQQVSTILIDPNVV